MVSDGRSALLSSIQKGSKLKKTVTNDRSAALGAGQVLNGSKSSSKSSSASSKPISTRPSAESTASQSVTAAPFNPSAAGGLFANGMPKLKKSANSLPIRGETATSASSAPEAPPKRTLALPKLQSPASASASASSTSRPAPMMPRSHSMAAPPPPRISSGETGKIAAATNNSMETAAAAPKASLPPFLAKAPRPLAMQAKGVTPAVSQTAPKSAYCWNFPLGLPKPRSFSSIKSKKRTYVSGGLFGSSIPLPQQ